MEDAEKEQCEITEEGGEEVKRFISFVKVFHVLLTALTDGTQFLTNLVPRALMFFLGSVL